MDFYNLTEEEQDVYSDIIFNINMESSQTLKDFLKQQNIETTKQIINIKHPDPSQGYPLFRACKSNDIEKVKLLVEYGADVFLEDEHGNSAINITQNQEIQEYIQTIQTKIKEQNKHTIQNQNIQTTIIENQQDNNEQPTATIDTKPEKQSFFKKLFSKRKNKQQTQTTTNTNHNNDDNMSLFQKLLSQHIHKHSIKHRIKQHKINKKIKEINDLAIKELIKLNKSIDDVRQDIKIAYTKSILPPPDQQLYGIQTDISQTLQDEINNNQKENESTYDKAIKSINSQSFEKKYNKFKKQYDKKGRAL